MPFLLLDFRPTITEFQANKKTDWLVIARSFPSLAGKWNKICKAIKEKWELRPRRKCVLSTCWVHGIVLGKLGQRLSDVKDWRPKRTRHLDQIRRRWEEVDYPILLFQTLPVETSDLDRIEYPSFEAVLFLPPLRSLKKLCCYLFITRCK